MAKMTCRLVCFLSNRQSGNTTAGSNVPLTSEMKGVLARPNEVWSKCLRICTVEYLTWLSRTPERRIRLPKRLFRMSTVPLQREKNYPRLGAFETKPGQRKEWCPYPEGAFWKSPCQPCLWIWPSSWCPPELCLRKTEFDHWRWPVFGPSLEPSPSLDRVIVQPPQSSQYPRRGMIWFYLTIRGCFHR